MQAATLDIIANIPRSAFSTQQIQMMFWFLKFNGVSWIPSAKTLRNQNTALHSMCGIHTLEYDGAFGHKFFINSLADIICQEMANPRVHNYLRFYPEDAGKTVSEYWHARHWHEVADPSLVTLMVVINDTQFFIYELAILTNSSVVMPYRWFLQGRSIMARAWPLCAVRLCDGNTGWIIEEYKTVIVSGNGHVFNWTQTDPEVGNRWHVLAGGARVWNKHYLFLFLAAGLPRALFQHEYNVHFLCTSNLATLLEMMDGIVSQLKVAWKTGIWAWDCVHSDHVLVIPFVAALLGDNPMQSKFACHVGPGGKFLCRICDVKGVDGSINEFHSPIVPMSTDGANGGRTTPDSIGTSDGDGNSSADARAPATGWKRKLKSMQDMVARICAHKTSTGIKDTFLETFLEWMHLSHKNKSGRYDKHVTLDRFKATLPESTSMLSPVWQIQGLDPHTDTPVEILHTILLGFIKYFWHDVVHNQLGTNPPKKELLKTHLNSLDVSGLQIGQQLSRRTLVQYAGSLTGQDFRIIAQVAPYVLYDLVADPCFNTWVSLSNLFHFILHLLAHIRCFGPAVLFATETFESYNAIIWGKSVHSNRLAPSRNIAIAFAHYSRVRHLLSSGCHFF
ncbi:hypothetical protein EI94DRAFT_1773711 [Lactarius quietus]|nr:hypothetical protein EI94DRAFT_1773711 [Lactarius quietus]